MKINWIIPFTNMTGGIKVVFEHTYQLQQMGHEVKIFMPCIAYDFGAGNLWKRFRDWESFSRNNTLHGKADWYPHPMPIVKVPWISDLFLPEADVVIATAWPTAYSVAKLNPSKGKKFYFIQHYEDWTRVVAKVDGSYRLPIHHIVIATWLQELMLEKFQKKPAALVPNGVDTQVFYPEPDPILQQQAPYALLLYHDLPWKGFADGITVYQSVRLKHPELKLKVFGMMPPPELPEGAEYFQAPSPSQLRKLYSNAFAFLSPSWKEGWHLPPMEAMCCNCPVIATNVGCIPDIGKHLKTAMVHQVQDINGMTQSFSILLQDPSLRDSIRNQGYNLMQDYTWHRSSQQFLSSLCIQPT